MVAYLVYVTLSVAFTVWVARTLYLNGQVFLEASLGNVAMASAINKLLVVGFYLVNIGFVALFLQYGDRPATAIECFETISHKLGIVLLVLGLWHFLNMFNIAKIYGKRRRREERAEPSLSDAP